MNSETKTNQARDALWDAGLRGPAAEAEVNKPYEMR